MASFPLAFHLVSMELDLIRLQGQRRIELRPLLLVDRIEPLSRQDPPADAASAVLADVGLVFRAMPTITTLHLPTPPTVEHVCQVACPVLEAVPPGTLSSRIHCVKARLRGSGPTAPFWPVRGHTRTRRRLEPFRKIVVLPDVAVGGVALNDMAEDRHEPGERGMARKTSRSPVRRLHAVLGLDDTEAPLRVLKRAIEPYAFVPWLASRPVHGALPRPRARLACVRFARKAAPVAVGRGAGVAARTV